MPTDIQPLELTINPMRASSCFSVPPPGPEIIRNGWKLDNCDRNCDVYRTDEKSRIKTD
jgi:hypothetical protein